MSMMISLAALVVPHYDRGIDFYCRTLGFDLVEDVSLDETKRRVVVRPSGSDGWVFP